MFGVEMPYEDAVTNPACGSGSYIGCGGELVWMQYYQKAGTGTVPSLESELYTYSASGGGPGPIYPYSTTAPTFANVNQWSYLINGGAVAFGAGTSTAGAFSSTWTSYAKVTMPANNYYYSLGWAYPMRQWGLMSSIVGMTNNNGGNNGFFHCVSKIQILYR
jgi:hypothetical protein